MAQPLQIVSVIIVLRCENKFLLVQRNDNDDIFPGKWQNLGGKIEQEETVEKAIRREIKEEIGLKVDKYPIFLQSYSWKKDSNSPTRLGLIFLVNLVRRIKNYKIKLDKELENSGWFTLEQINNMNNDDMLIGKDSSTGTFGQLSQVPKVLRLLESNKRLNNK